MNLLQEGEEEENADFKYGVCAMQGWRTEMVNTCCFWFKLIYAPQNKVALPCQLHVRTCNLC